MRKICFGLLVGLLIFAFEAQADEFVLKTVKTEGLKRVEKETVMAFKRFVHHKLVKITARIHDAVIA